MTSGGGISWSTLLQPSPPWCSTFLPLPLPPLTPSTAHSSRRRSLELAEHPHCRGPRKEIYLPWQRHQQLSSGCPVPLPHTPSPSPRGGTHGEPMDDVCSTCSLTGEQPRLYRALLAQCRSVRVAVVSQHRTEPWMLGRGLMAYLDIRWEI